VGGGQAGLAMSYYLKQKGREHVVLERAPTVANAWRNERWASFTLVTPNFQVRMPGAEYQGNDPNGFISLAEVVEYFDDYVKRFGLPVHCGVEVFSVEKTREGYLARTSEGNYDAENVVIATGLYQSPKIPKFSEAIRPSVDGVSPSCGLNCDAAISNSTAGFSSAILVLLEGRVSREYLLFMLLERLPEVQSLTPEDKWRLIDELWSDLARQVEATGPDKNIVELLEKRFSDYLADPSQARGAEEAFARLAEHKRQWK
jgi:putative addiction module component (TIGR02574 family)